MEIVLTNDDGVFSPGLAASIEAAMGFGNVHVFAPSIQKTGTGRALIGKKGQTFEQVDLEIAGKTVKAFHIDCTPALVLKHALRTTLRDIQIDLVISGINYGENIGYDITMSGTVGAAIEAAVLGIPAFAVSLQTPTDSHLTYGDTDWNAAKYFVSYFIEHLKKEGEFRGFDILKLDIPQTATPETEWKLSRLSRHTYFKPVFEDPDPETGISTVKLTVDAEPHQPGTDAYTLLNEKKVAVTPLSLDFTAENCREYFS